jgi:hypothetical protein
MPSKSESVETSSISDPRRHIRVEQERVRDVSSVDYPGHFPGEDHSWNLATFEKVHSTFKIYI